MALGSAFGTPAKRVGHPKLESPSAPTRTKQHIAPGVQASKPKDQGAVRAAVGETRVPSHTSWEKRP